MLLQLRFEFLVPSPFGKTGGWRAAGGTPGRMHCTQHLGGRGVVFLALLMSSPCSDPMKRHRMVMLK